MKITIQNKTIEIPVTSKVYSDIKSVLVEAAGQSKMGHDEYEQHWKNADYNMGSTDKATQASGIASANKLIAFHKAHAHLFKKYSRGYGNISGLKKLAEGHQEMCDHIKKSIDVAKNSK